MQVSAGLRPSRIFGQVCKPELTIIPLSAVFVDSTLPLADLDLDSSPVEAVATGGSRQLVLPAAKANEGPMAGLLGQVD